MIKEKNIKKIENIKFVFLKTNIIKLSIFLCINSNYSKQV